MSQQAVFNQFSLWRRCERCAHWKVGVCGLAAATIRQGMSEKYPLSEASINAAVYRSRDGHCALWKEKTIEHVAA